jgi:hypothetical protein
MTDIVPTTHTALSEQMEFSRVVTSGDARNSLLPQAYRGNPGNALIAVGLGAAMGLSPAESLYRIDVIQGTPTASAELIAQNVRRAGHKLRVQVTENPPAATATIVRADDPDYPVTVTRDMAWAQTMGLASKDNYKKQPATMLQWRAITACARLACPEALYGVAYTSDEIESIPGTVTSSVTASTADFMTQDEAPAEQPVEDVQDAEEVPDAPAPEPKLSDRNRGRLFALFAEKGIPEADQLAGIAHVIGRTPSHRDALNEDEFARVIAQLETRPDAEAQS